MEGKARQIREWLSSFSSGASEAGSKAMFCVASSVTPWEEKSIGSDCTDVYGVRVYRKLLLRERKYHYECSAQVVLFTLDDYHN